jgi:serine/threonine-protein kinase
VYVGSLDVAADAQSSTRLLAASSSAMFAVNPMKAGEGHLLFMRNNTLLAQRFNLSSLSLEGDPQRVAEPVGLFNDRGAFSVSQTGRLVYREGSSSGLSLAMFTPDGGLKLVGEQATYYGVALAPDGTKAAVTRIGANRDIWLYDVGRDVSTRFTFHSALDDVPIWSPDGRTIVFGSDRSGTRQLFMKPANGARDEELLLNTGAIVAPSDWSRDGRYILYTVRTPGKGLDVNVLDYETRRTATLLGTMYDEDLAGFSPDGQWVGYLSNESGRPELYVRRFVVEQGQPVVAGKWMISNSGAYGFQWGNSGRTIYYVPRSPANLSAASLAPMSTTTGGLTIEAVDVAPAQSEFAVGRPRTHMKVPGTIYGLSLRADGSMAMLVVPGRSDTRSTDLDVVVNWQELLAR